MIVSFFNGKVHRTDAVIFGKGIFCYGGDVACDGFSEKIRHPEDRLEFFISPYEAGIIIEYGVGQWQTLEKLFLDLTVFHGKVYHVCSYGFFVRKSHHQCDDGMNCSKAGRNDRSSHIYEKQDTGQGDRKPRQDHGPVDVELQLSSVIYPRIFIHIQITSIEFISNIEPGEKVLLVVHVGPGVHKLPVTVIHGVYHYLCQAVFREVLMAESEIPEGSEIVRGKNSRTRQRSVVPFFVYGLQK